MTQGEMAKVMLTTTPGVVTEWAMKACGVRRPKYAVARSGVRVLRINKLGWRTP